MMLKLASLALLAVLVPACAVAESFPSTSITIVVPFTPGGAADATTRVIAQKMGENLKQTVIVDNRPGAGGQIGAAVVKRAAADGHTLFLANSGSHATNKAMYARLSYDPEKDFEPVVALVKIPQLLVVPAGGPVDSVSGLIAHAKAHPGKVSYASQSVGAGGHIAAEVLRAKNGLQLNHIPYKGSAPALQDLVAGRVDFMFDAMPSSLPFVKDKRLRALAIDAPKRSALLPDVPTLVEQGLTGYEASPWFGVVAPAGTPRPVIDKLAAEANAALRDPEVRARLGALGIEPVGGSPGEFAGLMKADTQRLGRVIQEAGIKLD